MKMYIKELNDGTAVIETQHGNQLSFFKNISEAQLAYIEWYVNNEDIFSAEDDNYYLM